MKKIHIIGILLIGVAIYLFSISGKDLATFSTFQDAVESAGKVKIAGTLAKEKEMYYEPTEDPNYFSFYVRDMEGGEQKVILHAAKPQDFELSEQIVITGKMENGDFHASDLLMKCPSKYKDEEIYIKSEKS